MPNEQGDSTSQRTGSTQLIKNRQRDPNVFSGTSDEDVDDWTKHYERVSSHNNWDDTIKLANVVFFLKGTALHWYDNHEEEIGSWDVFKSTFTEVFGKPACRRQQASDVLSRRFQAATESSTSYIEDVLRLCRRVDKDMSEDNKVRHLFKGLSHELFSVVAPKTPTTVESFIADCKRYEGLQSGRLLHSPFERLPEVTPSHSSLTDLASLIRDVVRNELRSFMAEFRAAAPAAENVAHATSDFNGIQRVVQDEIRSALHSVSPVLLNAAPSAPACSSMCAMQHESPRGYGPLTRMHRPSGFVAPRRPTDVWRTDDQRPICFYCGSPGHILRYCRRRIYDTPTRQVPSGQPPYEFSVANTSFNDRRPHGRYGESTSNLPFDDRRPRSPPPTQNRRTRSPSPYPRRSRSVSPLNAAATLTHAQSN